jgi:hypothetical protein
MNGRTLDLDHASIWILSVIEDDFVQMCCFHSHEAVYLFHSLPLFEVKDSGW